MDEEAIRRREEPRSKSGLHKLKRMAESYGYDISQPAEDTREAIQWLYFAYLAAVRSKTALPCPGGHLYLPDHLRPE